MNETLYFLTQYGSYCSSSLFLWNRSDFRFLLLFQSPLAHWWALVKWH